MLTGAPWWWCVMGSPCARLFAGRSLRGSQTPARSPRATVRLHGSESPKWIRVVQGHHRAASAHPSPACRAIAPTNCVTPRTYVCLHGRGGGPSAGREVVGVDDDCRDREVLVAAIATAARLRAWLDGRNVRMAARLAEVTTRPEQIVAQAARTSVRDADRVVERSRTVSAIPALGEALDNGTVSGGHVDAVGRVLRQLEPAHRDTLTASAGWLGRSWPREDTRGAAQGVDRRGGPAPRR